MIKTDESAEAKFEVEDWGDDFYVCQCSFGEVTDCCGGKEEEGRCSECGSNEYFMACATCHFGDGCSACPDCGLGDLGTLEW